MAISSTLAALSSVSLRRLEDCVSLCLLITEQYLKEQYPAFSLTSFNTGEGLFMAALPFSHHRNYKVWCLLGVYCSHPSLYTCIGKSPIYSHKHDSHQLVLATSRPHAMPDSCLSQWHFSCCRSKGTGQVICPACSRSLFPAVIFHEDTLAHTERKPPVIHPALIPPPAPGSLPNYPTGQMNCSHGLYVAHGL